MDGYNLEAQQNILLTKYFIGLNNFLIKSANQFSNSAGFPSSMKMAQSNEDYVGLIESLYTFNVESKIEIYLKKRKNINIEIYHRFETISRNFY